MTAPSSEDPEITRVLFKFGLGQNIALRALPTTRN